MVTIFTFLEEHSNLIGLCSSICMLFVTTIYAVITWWNAKNSKKILFETIKQNREERQPYIVPTIGDVKGSSFDTSTSMRIQLNFNYKLENVGDSSAVTIYTMLYARMEYQSDHKLVYAHLMPNYKHSLKVGQTTKEMLHFETDEFREIIEDLEISYAKNMKRIETDPTRIPFKGPSIILRTLYQNMIGQWFESVLEQELLEVEKLSKEPQKTIEVGGKKFTIKNKSKMVTNKDIKNNDFFEGGMINPCYSKLSRRMVDADYVKHILKDCKNHSKSIIDYWENE